MTWGLVVFMLAIVGVTTMIWGAIGLIRWLTERDQRRRPTVPKWSSSDIAVLMAAHNEEAVLEASLRRALSQFSPEQIHVVSDGSADRTADIARRLGVRVLELNPNRGKAGALSAGITHFRLTDRYEFVLLLDADTHLADDYSITALRLADDDDVAAVAGRARTLHPEAAGSLLGRLLVWYRERVYTVVQYLHKYGQAASWINAVYIVPGFASLYRSRAIRQIDIDAPGLVIEDYNMTFEVHARRLGRVAFHPHAAIAYTQDPDTLVDYTRQLSRWTLGFWQTLLRHRPRPSLFWATVLVHALELVLSSLITLLWLPLFMVSAICTAAVWLHLDGNSWGAVVASQFPPVLLLAGLWLPDLLVTLISSVLGRRWGMLLFAPFYPFMRIYDASRCLRSLARALTRRRSSGSWISPDRRPETVEASSSTKSRREPTAVQTEG
ncbi:glycosyltransferase [Pseudoclavibacter sp. 13-3]|uniref:glycosyltransferase n=1 Tax=Pseudoclavibacter sp. 13-3 TaxID=2901228 RepID=UPI001E441FC7|nr:glycosyltransferase family 2 protein [Pseudoclavibacter sp. 13-3]MCD7100523.1 glycosyltransferase family 2 protein [Pseudoclavibacter sp. 13-3]